MRFASKNQALVSVPLAGFLLVIPLWSCAATPPETVPVNRGGGDANVAAADKACSDAGRAKIVAAGSSAMGIEKLCGYKSQLVSSQYVYRGSGDPNVLMQQIDSSGNEISVSKEMATSFRLVSYSGLLASTGDIGAVVDVVRFQAFFPTDFKSQYEVDPLVTYSPVGQASAGFVSTSYNFQKTGSDGLGDVDYGGAMRVLHFSDGSYAVVDKLDRKNGGSLEQYNGVVLYFPVDSQIAVVGRSEQGLAGQNQTAETVSANVRSQMSKSLKRDFANYSKPQPARQYMDSKRSGNGSGQ